MRIAIVRNPLHVALLVDNRSDVDEVWYRERFMEPTLVDSGFETRHIGREMRPEGLGEVRAARAHNRAYYANLRTTISDCRVSDVIAFLESEPLEEFVRGVVGDDHIELWEEGMAHYVDLEPLYRVMFRSAVQTTVGFYPRRPWIRRWPADLRRRDRFAERSLVLSRPIPSDSKAVARVLLIGTPLIQDGRCSERAFLRGLATVVSASALPVDYVPHPREDLADIASEIRAIGAHVVKRSLAEVLGTTSYVAYVTSYSSGILDVPADRARVMCPKVFGLHRYARELSGSPIADEVRIIDDVADLGDFITGRKCPGNC